MAKKNHHFSSRSNAVKAARKALDKPAATEGTDFTLSQSSEGWSWTPIAATTEGGAKAPEAPAAPPAADKKPKRTKAKKGAGKKTPAKKAGAKKPAKPKKPAAKAPRKPRGHGDTYGAFLKLVTRPAGATVAQIMAKTDWLPHTARARLSTLKHAGDGTVVATERPKDAADKSMATVYRVTLPKAKA